MLHFGRVQLFLPTWWAFCHELHELGHEYANARICAPSRPHGPTTPHSRTVPSHDPEARVSPSGAKATPPDTRAPRRRSLRPIRVFALNSRTA
jgi:hypothetical protein